MKKDIRIVVKNVSKKFTRRFEKSETILSFLLRLFSKKTRKENFYALRDISFSVKAGENIGIIGRNGGGKSTLLRIIAEIYKQDEGDLDTKGKVVYIAGYGQGLNDKLTMRENIYLVGSLMGLGRRDISSRFKEIVNFSGLKDYVDVKISEFSSGMVSRLNFSISLFCLKHQNPEILLMDEIGLGAGGGDIDFQKKTKKKMKELLKGGASVILASHNLSTVRENCDKVIWLEKGEIEGIGKPAKVIRAYQNSSKKEKKIRFN
jgi:ABC-type polysaccharide/polyol phosphate transport system ATPase subunit